MVGLVRDRTKNDRLQVTGDRRIEPARAGRCSIAHLVQQFAQSEIAEGRVEREQLVDG
jgi:hypothetical protein